MSLVPARYNFIIYQGATFYSRIYYSIDGNIKDVTGFDAKLVVKDEPEGTTLLILTVGDGIDLGGTLGTIDLLISATDTSNLTWSEGFYELFVTDLTPHTDVLTRGGFKVIPF